MTQWREIGLPEASAILSDVYGWKEPADVPAADPMMTLVREHGDPLELIYRGRKMPSYEDALQIIKSYMPAAPEQILIINMSTMFVRPVAFLVSSDAFEAFVEHYEHDFKRPFYHHTDLILVWLSRHIAIIMHHEGIVALSRPSLGHGHA